MKFINWLLVLVSDKKRNILGPMLILSIELQNDYKTIKLDSPKTAWSLD